MRTRFDSHRVDLDPSFDQLAGDRRNSEQIRVNLGWSRRTFGRPPGGACAQVAFNSTIVPPPGGVSKIGSMMAQLCHIRFARSLRCIACDRACMSVRIRDRAGAERVGRAGRQGSAGAAGQRREAFRGAERWELAERLPGRPTWPWPGRHGCTNEFGGRRPQSPRTPTSGAGRPPSQSPNQGRRMPGRRAEGLGPGWGKPSPCSLLPHAHWPKFIPPRPRST